MKFEQKSQDRKRGMTLIELEQFILRVRALGADSEETLKANSIKIKSVSMEFEPRREAI
jgi:hypothetical protein